MPVCQALTLVLVTFTIFICQAALADHPQTEPGHSGHAEAFNDGPRQAAYLMSGMGNVHWEISTKNPMAQRFFDQGIIQLHGFWYFEAERSFRQAAAFDPECAMLYWGMARANIENPWRSKGFSEQAMKKIANAPDKEKRLVEAWNNRVKDTKAEPVAEDDVRANTPAEKKAAAKAKKRENDEERKEKKERLKQYVQDLEAIACDYPDDIEIKAMLVLQYWQNNGSGIEIQSHFAINSILSDIFHANPKHPAQHFRIHLWDYRKEKLAIDAAAKCGPSAPGIAHMWHMPGHTYSRLHRYADAAWQQEASARVDHAHMIRDQVMPDQIHNYAHNNEWLIRDLMLIGRVKEALDLAKNMIELPRHPKYNILSGRGSASLGRERLLGVLTTYRLWPELIELSNSAYLEPTDDELKQDERKAWIAIAYSQVDDQLRLQKVQSEFASLLETLQGKAIEGRDNLDLLAEKEDKDKKEEKDKKKWATRPPKLLEPYELSQDPFGEEDDPSLAKMPSKDIDDSKTRDWSDERKEKASDQAELEYRIAKLKQLQLAVGAYVAASQGNYRKALDLSHQCRPVINAMTRIEWLAQAGYTRKALDRIKKRIEDGPGELLPLAIGVWIAAQNDREDDEIKKLAKQWLAALSPIAATADSPLPLLDRVLPTVDWVGEKEKWRVAGPAPTDVGDRPALDSLGPFRWTPSLAPVWSATDADGETRSAKQFGKRPLVLIFYLGFGCLHCAEQLKEFSPMVEHYQAAGIDVAAMSTEALPQLQAGVRKYSGEMRIPLMANPEGDIFKAFRCFDDFEGVPLHGTFLIDTNGRIRWQDIGHKPFMDPKFLLEESTRLLRLP
jgi:peroxiredoxin